MTKKTEKTMRRYDAKMIKQGYGRVSLWVPESDKAELTAIALEMRQEHAKALADQSDQSTE